MCYHNGPETDPDNRDKPDTQGILRRMQGYVRDHMPSLESTPSIVEPCMYTVPVYNQFLHILFTFNHSKLSVRFQVRDGLLSLFFGRMIKVTIQSWVVIYMRMRNTKVVCHSRSGISHPVSQTSTCLKFVALYVMFDFIKEQNTAFEQ